MATAGSSRASGAVAGDGLPELSGSAPGMIAGRETTPPECEEAVSDSGCCQNWCRGRESNPHRRYAQRFLSISGYKSRSEIRALVPNFSSFPIQ
jgi:hypothetical protein